MTDRPRHDAISGAPLQARYKVSTDDAVSLQRVRDLYLMLSNTGRVATST
jgi:hypothetical protein